MPPPISPKSSPLTTSVPPTPLNSAYLIALIVFLFYVTLTAIQLIRSHNDPTTFIHAGTTYVDPARTPAPLHLTQGPGYDGEFYYRLALRPNLIAVTDNGITLDRPSYRIQRIAYPFLAWCIALGNPSAVPSTLILLNLAWLTILGFIGGKIAQHFNHHALGGLLLALWPGLLYSLTRDLTEIQETACLACGLYAIMRQRHLAAALFLTLAVLTRETASIAVAAIFISALARFRDAPKPRDRLPILFPLIPLIIFAAWQCVLWRIWSKLPLLANPIDRPIPFASLIKFATTHHLPAISTSHLILIALFTLIVLWAAPHSRADRSLKRALPAYALLFTILPARVWIDPAAPLRAISEFALLGGIILLAGLRLPWLAAFCLCGAYGIVLSRAIITV
jgi:hypothetical protein